MEVEDRSARYPLTIDPIAQQAYLKASNTGAGDQFGWSVAVSGDTVVVGEAEPRAQCPPGIYVGRGVHIRVGAVRIHEDFAGLDADRDQLPNLDATLGASPATLGRPKVLNRAEALRRFRPDDLEIVPVVAGQIEQIGRLPEQREIKGLSG